MEHARQMPALSAERGVPPHLTVELPREANQVLHCLEGQADRRFHIVGGVREAGEGLRRCGIQGVRQHG